MAPTRNQRIQNPLVIVGKMCARWRSRTGRLNCILILGIFYFSNHGPDVSKPVIPAFAIVALFVRMYLLITPFFTIFLFVLQHSVVAATSGRRIQERQDGDAAFCFGYNSICSLSNNLWSQCENYLSDTPQWYKCICGNGYVSVDEAWVFGSRHDWLRI